MPPIYTEQDLGFGLGRNVRKNLGAVVEQAVEQSERHAVEVHDAWSLNAKDKSVVSKGRVRLAIRREGPEQIDFGKIEFVGLAFVLVRD